jgi:hypothetical protein
MTTLSPIQGKVAAQAGNGYVSVRTGSANVVCAVTAVIPGKGGQRPAGAVINFYADVEAAVKAADKINASKGDWKDGRVVPAVQALGVDGKVDKEATKKALWLRAEDIFTWLEAEKKFLTPVKPSGRRQSA